MVVRRCKGSRSELAGPRDWEGDRSDARSSSAGLGSSRGTRDAVPLRIQTIAFVARSWRWASDGARERWRNAHKLSFRGVVAVNTQQISSAGGRAKSALGRQRMQHLLRCAEGGGAFPKARPRAGEQEGEGEGAAPHTYLNRLLKTWQLESALK